MAVKAGAARKGFAGLTEEETPFYAWSNQMKITFPEYTSARESLRDFPVLLIFRDGPADLRFTAADKRTELPYEIESPSHIWVRLPELKADTVIYAFWGKPGAEVPSYTTDASTWDNRFVGVWHMTEEPEDAGRGEHHGCIVGQGVKLGQAGRVGQGLRVTQAGGNGGIKVADHDALDFGEQDFTIEMWIRKEAHSKGWKNIGSFGKWHTGASPGSNEWSLGTSAEGSDDRPGFSIEIDKTAHSVRASENLTLNQWAHIAGVREGETMTLYVDGREAGRRTGVKGPVNNVGRDLHFGYFPSKPALSLRASLDEYRISSTVRSADWIWATHRAIAANEQFVHYQMASDKPEFSVEASRHFAGHWAYERPIRPALPEVSDSNWPRQPVDHFILA
ncbi:MAG: LamG domain-containing protein, partial [Verrucomicrobiota bacterium]